MPSAPEHFSLNGHRIFIHRRARKRTIALTMQLNGSLKVSASLTTPLSHIRDFVLQNTDWIDKQAEAYEKVRDKFPRKFYRDGEEFLFLGEPTVLTFREGAGAWLKFRHVKGDQNLFICEVPAPSWKEFDALAAHPEMAPLFQRFYEMAGRQLLTQRVDVYAERMGLRPKALSFRSQKTRWGSCSSRGTLSLNWRLSFAPPRVIDYVVVHELAHLQHYDHSKRFWALVGTQLPNYRQLRQWLRRHQYDADFLGRKSDLYGAQA